MKNALCVAPISLALAIALAAVPHQASGQNLAATATSVDDVAIDITPDGRPRVRIHAGRASTLRHFALTGPQRIVLDIGAPALTAAAPTVPAGLEDRLQRVRVARFQTNVVRVVLDLPREEPYSVDQQGPWWVVTFDRPSSRHASAPAEPAPQQATDQAEVPPPTRPVPAPEPSAEARHARDTANTRVDAPVADRPAADAPPSDPATQPDGTLEVQVTRVSGTTVYINAGSNHGLGKGQEVQAERKAGRGRGTLEVLSTTSRGAVLGFAGRPFPLTRGDGLRLKLPQTRGPDRAIADPSPEPTSATPTSTPTSSEEQVVDGPVDPTFALPPNVTGRISMELDGRASRSEWDPLSLDATRTFLTPLTRLQFTAREVGPGMTVRGRMRAAYRYGSDGVINPSASVRIYEFDAEKRFEGVPLRVQVGRFFSPYEAFSGYFDGLLVRMGNDGAGVGASVGLEPDRWNQSFSTTRPKATGFVDFRKSGGRGGFESAFSATHVRPTDSQPNQLYFGSSGHAWLGRFGISHTIQIDQRQDTNAWVISDLLVQSSVPISRNFEVHGRWSLREPNYFWLDTPFSYRRDDISAGATVRWNGGSLLTDAGLHDVEGDPTRTRSASAALRLNAITPARLGMRLAAQVWDGPQSRVATASLSFDRIAGDAWINGGYRMYRSDGAWLDQTTHQVDATVSWALPDGVRLTGLSSTLLGKGILQQRLQVGFSRSF